MFFQLQWFHTMLSICYNQFVTCISGQIEPKYLLCRNSVRCSIFYILGHLTLLRRAQCFELVYTTILLRARSDNLSGPTTLSFSFQRRLGRIHLNLNLLPDLLCPRSYQPLLIPHFVKSYTSSSESSSESSFDPEVINHC